MRVRRLHERRGMAPSRLELPAVPAIVAQGSDELTAALLAARSLNDVRVAVLPRLRREVGLSAVGIVLNRTEEPTTIIDDGNSGRSAILQSFAAADGNLKSVEAFGELPLDRIDGRLIFLVDPREASSATAALRRICPFLGAALRNVLDFEKLYQMAITDPLTGLYNRRFFDEVLQRELSSSRRHDRLIALLAMDLDGFKRINDVAGHAAGDYALVEVARALRAATRQSDLVARTGGDEFLILMVAGNATRAQILANRIIRKIQSVSTAGTNGRLSASIGIATAPPWPVDPGEFIAGADSALYEAKRRGKGKSVFIRWDERAPDRRAG